MAWTNPTTRSTSALITASIWNTDLVDNLSYLYSKSVKQVVNSTDGAVATGTTTIPGDDTIPQNTEGTQFLSLAITPVSSTTKLIIDVIVNGAYSAQSIVACALFQDTTANALSVVFSQASNYNGANDPLNFHLRHYMTSGTTSSTTFKVRVGGGSAGTFTFNGVAGGRYYGGVMGSSITIMEI